MSASPPGAMAGLVPPGVAVVEAVGEPGENTVSAEEMATLGAAGDRRRREFAAGRTCARLALARLGRPATAIPRGPRGQPLWPDGIVGSITHCSGYVAAAVGWAADIAAIGIDAEPHEELHPGVLRRIASADEQAALSILEGCGRHWDRVLFSAKESVYKVWYPIAGRWLGFDDVTVAISPDASSFRARIRCELVVDGRLIDTVQGRFAITGGLILTAVTLERQARSGHPKQPSRPAPRAGTAVS